MAECIANMNENNNNGAIFKPAKPVFHAGSIHITITTISGLAEWTHVSSNRITPISKQIFTNLP